MAEWHRVGSSSPSWPHGSGIAPAFSRQLSRTCPPACAPVHAGQKIDRMQLQQGLAQIGYHLQEVGAGWA